MFQLNPTNSRDLKKKKKEGVMGKAELICATQNSDSSACKRGELRHSTGTSGSLKKAGSQHYAKLIGRKQSPLGTAVIKY